MRKAIIDNLSSKVINIIETGENGVQGLILPLNQTIWDSTQFDVQIGDNFSDGIFYRANKPLIYVPTVEEKITSQEQKLLQTENTLLSIMDTMTNSTLKGNI